MTQRPKFIKETFQEACKRVPELERFFAEKVSDTILDVLTLLDTIDGYEIFHVHSGIGISAVYVYKRVDGD